jgi:hypothetical protein
MELRHPGKGTWGELLPRARIIPLAITAILAVATAIECHARATGIDSFLSWFFSLAYGCTLWLWWALAVDLLWRAGARWAFALRVSLPTLGIQAPVAVGIVALHLGILQEATQWIAHAGPQAIRAEYAGPHFFDLPRFGIELLIYALVWLACAAVNVQLKAQRDAIAALELQRQLSAAQLRALQMQIEPHFLFNTLNAITTLVELGRQAEAVEMLSHLNAILKSTLKRTMPEKIRLSQELEIVENYLAIEQVRFADRLRIELKVEPSALDSLVPCFLLQPIVENAIRHGIAHCESEGLVEASARRDGDVLRLNVRDSGSRLSGQPKPGNGIGLTNTRERLVHFYQDSFDMKALPLEKGGFEVAIAIPYERG